MSAPIFAKATKKRAFLRLALMGPSGSGKTLTALLVAQRLGARIAVIDTERGSSTLYADRFDFSAVELTNFAPSEYRRMISACAAERFDVLIIDSLSHAWMGEGGILDQADKKGSRFDAWKSLTPQHNALIAAMLDFPGHLIATMRSKTDYLVDKDEKTGRSRVEKVGLAPVQRDGMEYEFDVVGMLDHEHVLHVSKSRCSALAADIRDPGAQLGDTLRRWLAAAPAPVQEAPRTSAEHHEPQRPAPRLVASQPSPIVASFKAQIEADDYMSKCASILDAIGVAYACGEMSHEECKALYALSDARRRASLSRSPPSTPATVEASTGQDAELIRQLFEDAVPGSPEWAEAKAHRAKAAKAGTITQREHQELGDLARRLAEEHAAKAATTANGSGETYRAIEAAYRGATTRAHLAEADALCSRALDDGVISRAQGVALVAHRKVTEGRIEKEQPAREPGEEG